MFEPLTREQLDLMTAAELAEYETLLLQELADTETADIRPVDWRELARPEQLPPDEWLTWYIRGGRGGGKTWTGANAFAELIQTSPPGEWGVIAPTYGDARDTCIESAESGLLVALGLPRSYAGWNRSMGELRLPSGSVIYADGADDGALRVQGKNLRGAWCDEIGLWKRWQVAWDESVRFAVRKAPGKKIATGTPKRGMPAIKLVRRLMADPRVVKTLLRTEDNAENLHPETLEELLLLRGTSLGQQELEGAVLDDDEGGLFLRDDWQLWSFGDDGLLHLPRLGPDGRPDGRLDRFTLADCMRFITTDLAASVRTSADYTVAGAWAIAPSGDLILLDRRRSRVPEVDHAAFVEPLRKAWLTPYDAVHVEASFQSSSLFHALGRSQVPAVVLRAKADKVTRAVPYARMVRQHQVWLPAGASWLDEWIEEHTDFPVSGDHDDQVDVGSYAAQVAIEHWVRPPTADEDAAIQAAQREATSTTAFGDYTVGTDLMSLPL